RQTVRRSVCAGQLTSTGSLALFSGGSKSRAVLRTAAKLYPLTPMTTPSPLEAFVRDYVEEVGGAWAEVEPPVDELLLPPAAAAQEMGAAGQEVVRVAFDPEALPEHPGSQLASFGTPFIDRLLQSAIAHGRRAQFYFVGLNLSPHDLAARVRRPLDLAAGL